MTKSEVLFIRMEPSDYEWLALLARKYDVSLSQVARVLLRNAKRSGVGEQGHGLYLPDPDTEAGAAVIDQVVDASDDQEA